MEEAVLLWLPSAFVREDNQKTVFYKDGKTVEIPVLSYTQTVPALREEYDNYALVHFIPLTMWNKTLGQVCEGKSDSYIRILSKAAANLADLSGLEQEIVRLVSEQYEIESENALD